MIWMMVKGDIVVDKTELVMAELSVNKCAVTETRLIQLAGQSVLAYECYALAEYMQGKKALSGTKQER